MSHDEIEMDCELWACEARMTPDWSVRLMVARAIKRVASRLEEAAIKSDTTSWDLFTTSLKRLVGGL